MSGMVDSPSRMSTSGREAFPDVREWSGCHVGCLGRPVDQFRSSGRPFRPLPDIKEGLLDVREWSGVSPGSPGVVGSPRVIGMPSQMCSSYREPLQDDREWTRDPLGCPGVIGMTSRMSGSCWEALPISGSGREAFPDVR